MLEIKDAKHEETDNSRNFPPMKTLHITNSNQRIEFFPSMIEKQKVRLMKDLYNECLNADPLFHFFYEPDIVIRITSETVLKKASEYLNSKNIKYIVYDYPTPMLDSNKKYYGETPGGIVIRNPDLFLPLFHAHSVAALRLNDDDHFSYMERAIHTMWNPRGYSREEEGNHLATLAGYKLNVPIGPIKSNEDNEAKKDCKIV